MRIGGLSSGMDTEAIIKNLMSVEKMKVNRFYQQEQKLKWKQDAYQDVNKKFANFILNTRKDFGLNQISYTGEIYKSSVDSLTWTKKATSSNENLLSITAGASTSNGNHTVVVKALASNANVISKVESENIEIEGTGKFTITTSDKANSAIDIIVDESASISSIVSQINSKGKELGLVASYDKSSQRLLITNKNSGEANYIDIAADSSDPEHPSQKLLEKLGLTEGKTPGTNALISFNGEDIEKETNNFTLFGMAFNLKEASPTTNITINVDVNVDGILEKIVGFVGQYNNFVDEMSKQLNQEVYRSYKPLTKDEKDGMSDKEIEKWEEAAKSGILRNDSIISKALQTVREGLYDKIKIGEDQYVHLTDLGITTGNYQDRGKLIINEEKLRKAISEDPEKVMNVFFKVPDSGSTNKYEETGIIQRLYDGLTDGMKDIVKNSGPGQDSTLLRDVRGDILTDFVKNYSSISIIGKNLTDLNSLIAREEKLLISKEERFWAKFTEMEKAMTKMNQQSSWLMQQLGFGS